MSDFGDFSSTTNDPSADFLARERAVLGGDADIFTTLDDNPPSTTFTATPDLLDRSSAQSQYGIMSPSTPANDYSAFESNYPKTENLETSKAFHNAMLPDEEPDVVRQWRENQKQLIAKRDEDESNKKQEVLNKAREDIDKFYEDYNDKKQKAIEENREREDKLLKSREESSASTNIWASVSREIDVSNAKAAYPTRDVSRMKSIILDLRKDQSAPDGDIDYFHHLQRYSALYRILLATPYSTKLTFKQWYRVNLKLVNELDLTMTEQQKGNCWLEVGCHLLVEKNKSIVPCKESSIQCRPLQHDEWDSTTASDIAGFQNDTVGDLEFMVSLHDEGYVSSSTTSPNYYIQIYPKTQKHPFIMAFPLIIGPVTMEESSIHTPTYASINNLWEEPSTSNTIFHGYRLQDSSFLVIREDWSLGTPGKMWDSALVLSQMMTDKISHDPDYFRGGRFIDLSAGTGCLGLLIAALYKNIYRDHKHNMPRITLTDLPEALDLIQQNRSCNHLEGYTSVKSLEWGNYRDVQNLLLEGPIHTVIASDVLYRPSTFPSLVRTLVWLSEQNRHQIEIYVGYKRRGLALQDEKQFFNLCAESFHIITLSSAEICIKRNSNLEGWILTGEGDLDDAYKKTGVNIYQLVCK
ncbi:hypothetical protein [Parasitella parasitica]|uniref:Uncharacterized protein n=1 Tax=Parasitella parasitica TaxID=35722 RepID=A0A0B7N6Z4_9FUNG|nr:hypothetical protein [Parasitella parasitica]